MNRVLQAVGRVIRSDTDRGVVLLIDARFNETRYRRLFPAWWKYLRVRHTDGLREALAIFGNRCQVRSVDPASPARCAYGGAVRSRKSSTGAPIVK